jgi:hypothetical protein
LTGHGEGRRGVFAEWQVKRGRRRTFHADGSDTLGDVFQLHLVGDDVAADELVDLLAQLRLGIDQEMIGQAQQLQIGLDAALRVQEEGVAGVAGNHFLDFVAGDGVQQPRAIAPAGHNAAAPVEIQPSRALA